MGRLTKDYLRFAYAGRCNIVGSQNGLIQAVDKVSCAVSSGEAVSVFNMRTLEKSKEISRDTVEVTVFRYSDDRKQLAIGYSDGEIHLYRSEGKKGDFGEPIVFSGHRTGVNTLAFSNDGLTLASGGKDSIIVLWDIVSESGIYRFSGHKSTITQVQFTLDDKYLVSSSKDTQVKFWDIASQSCIYTLIDCTSEVYCFALIKNDRLLIVGTANLESQVYEIVWLDNSVDRSAEMDELPNKMSFLVGAEAFEQEHDQGNEVFRCIKRGILLRQAKGRTLQINVSVDESLICFLGSDSVIDVFRIFSEEESRKRFKKKLHKAKKAASEEIDGEQITQNEISKDISLLVLRVGVVHLPAKIKWIDLYREVRVKDTTMQYRICCLLKSNTIHGVLVDLDTKSNTITAESVVDLDYRGHRFDVRTLAVTSNNAAFLSGAADSAILWDMETLMPMNRFVDESLKDITSSLFVAGDKQFIVGTRTGSLFLFDIPNCELIENVKNAHDGSISQMLTLPDGKGFVTCSSDKTAIFWKFHLQTEIDRKRLAFRKEKTLELQDEILCMAISPNGKFIAFGLLDNTVRVYYLESLKFFLTLYGHSLPVTCVDIGPDNKLVATGSMDKTVKIWGLDFGDCHRSLFAHDDAVSCVKFNNDLEEQLFWSAGRDGKIKQWNAQKFDLIQTLNGHFSEIRALTLTSNANTLISASHDKSIRLWELTDELIVISDEQEKEREKEDLMRLVDAEDIVPGENPESLMGMAAKKNISSVKGAESILDALEIYREELVEQAENPKHKPHPLVVAYKSANLNHFVLDAINKVNAAHLERSLLLVPFDYIIDILKSLSKCVSQRYKLELAIRVSVFLFKTNLNQLASQKEFLPMMKNLQEILSTTVKNTKDQVNFNLAALRLHKLSIEERDEVQLFRKLAGGTSKKKPKSKKVRDIAIVNPIRT